MMEPSRPSWPGRNWPFVPPEVKVLLEKLRERPNVWVAIISGRSLEDIHAKVGVSGITYVGNYGLEIENPAGTHKKNWCE